jgi:hypothetical protein
MTVVSLPGVVDEGSGRVYLCPNLRWLEKANLRKVSAESLVRISHSSTRSGFSLWVTSRPSRNPATSFWWIREVALAPRPSSAANCLARQCP